MEAPSSAARIKLAERYVRLDEGRGGAIGSGTFGHVPPELLGTRAHLFLCM